MRFSQGNFLLLQILAEPRSKTDVILATIASLSKEDDIIVKSSFSFLRSITRNEEFKFVCYSIFYMRKVNLDEL